MLELTAGVRITRAEQMRGIIRANDSQFRTRYLEEIARQLATALMRAPGAVEITEQMEPITGDMVMRARVFVETANRMRGRGGVERSPVSDAMDALRYNTIPPGVFFSKPTDPIVNFGESQKQSEVLTREMIEKLQERMAQETFDPISFLKNRVYVADARKGAIESSKAKGRVDKQIRESTRTPGEALPVVKVKVRKIQMPEEAKG